jgi:hypothetical protein
MDRAPLAESDTQRRTRNDKNNREALRNWRCNVSIVSAEIARDSVD